MASSKKLDTTANGRPRKHLARQLPSIKHPPYQMMIKDAIAAEDKGNGASRHAINKWIKTLYSDLPYTHEALLDFNLRKFCDKGQIVKVKKSYKLLDSESSMSLENDPYSEDDDEPLSLPPPIQVPFYDLREPVIDFNSISVPRKPRSGINQRGNAQNGLEGRLGPVEPRWVVCYELVHSKVQFVQEKMKGILDGLKSELADEMAESSRLANAMKELDKLSSMNIFASTLEVDEIQEHESPSINVVHPPIAQPTPTSAATSSTFKRLHKALRKSVPKN